MCVENTPFPETRILIHSAEGIAHARCLEDQSLPADHGWLPGVIIPNRVGISCQRLSLPWIHLKVPRKLLKNSVKRIEISAPFREIYAFWNSACCRGIPESCRIDRDFFDGFEICLDQTFIGEVTDHCIKLMVAVLYSDIPGI